MNKNPEYINIITCITLKIEFQENIINLRHLYQYVNRINVIPIIILQILEFFIF